MTIQDVSDDMLMAYADGELESKDAAAVEQAAAHNPAVARRLKEFQDTRQFARDSFAAIKSRPVPPELVDAVIGRRAKPASSRPLPSARVLLPLAASIALVAGVAGWMLGQRQGSETVLASDSAVVMALEQAASGEERTFDGGQRVSVLGTYRLGDRVCRTFAVTGDTRSIKGIGCRSAGGWRIELAATAADPGQHAPASDFATQSIDAFLDTSAAEGPLDPAAEQALRQAGWHVGP